MSTRLCNTGIWIETSGEDERKEIETLKKRHFSFTDDNLVGNPGRAKGSFSREELLKPIGLTQMGLM